MALIKEARFLRLDPASFDLTQTRNATLLPSIKNAAVSAGLRFKTLFPGDTLETGALNILDTAGASETFVDAAGDSHLVARFLLPSIGDDPRTLEIVVVPDEGTTRALLIGSIEGDSQGLIHTNGARLPLRLDTVARTWRDDSLPLRVDVAAPTDPGTPVEPVTPTPTVSWSDTTGPVISGRAVHFAGGSLSIVLPNGQRRDVSIQIGGTWSLTVDTAVEAGPIVARLTMPDGRLIEANDTYTARPTNPPAVDAGFNAPQGVTARVSSDSRIRLEWRGVADAEQYNIERKASADTAYGYVTTVLAGATSYDDTPPGVGTWDYRVIAVNTEPSPLEFTPPSASVTATTGAPAGELDVSSMTLLFNDEFDEHPKVGGWTGEPGWRLDGVDDKWIAHTPWFGDFGDAFFADDRFDGDRPFAVRDGKLLISAWIDGAKEDGDPLWRSGLLSAVDTAYEGFKVATGYFEARMKIPDGPGTWPAFWLQSTRNAAGHNVEVDIIEHYGRRPGEVHHVWHVWETDPHVTRGTTVQVPGIASDFHRFGVEVTATEFIYYIDRIETWRATRPAKSLGVEFFPLVNLALGPGWPIDQTPNPSVLEVDYVRVFDNPNPTPPRGAPDTGGDAGTNWRSHMAFLDPAMVIDARTADTNNGATVTAMPNGGNDSFDREWRVSGQAVYRDSVAGLSGPALEFGPGASAVLEGLYYPQPFNLVVIGEVRRTIPGAVLAGAKDWSGDRVHAQIAQDGRWEMFGGVSGQRLSAVDTTPHVYLITAADGVHTLYIDGVKAAERSSTAGLNGMRVGALLDQGEPNTSSTELRLSYAAGWEGTLDAAGRERLVRLGNDYRTGTVGSDPGTGGGTTPTPTISDAERALDAEIATHTVPYHLAPRRSRAADGAAVTEIENAGSDNFTNVFVASGPVTKRSSEPGYSTPVLVCGTAASLVAAGNWYANPFVLFFIGEFGRTENDAVAIGAKDWSGDRSHIQAVDGKVGAFVGGASGVDIDTDPHVYALRVAGGTSTLYLDGAIIKQFERGGGLNGMRVGALLNADEEAASIHSGEVTVARAFAITGSLSSEDIRRISALGSDFIAGTVS